MKTIITAIAIVLTVVATAAHARLGANGIVLNGIQTNGIQTNGGYMNGIQANGVGKNGSATNSQYGTPSFDALRVIGVEIPANTGAR